MRTIEVTFYNVRGWAIAYCQDRRTIYAFRGEPLAYLDGDSVFGFDGAHLGWWDHGWVRDHDGACVFFTEAATGSPSRPAARGRPAKGSQQPAPEAATKQRKPRRPAERPEWSPCSGSQFFEATSW